MSADMMLLTDVTSLEKITYEHGQLLISVAVAANGVVTVLSRGLLILLVLLCQIGRHSRNIRREQSHSIGNAKNRGDECEGL